MILNIVEDSIIIAHIDLIIIARVVYNLIISHSSDDTDVRTILKLIGM